MGREFIELVLTSRSKRNRCACLCQLKCAGPSNSLRGAGHHGNPSCKRHEFLLAGEKLDYKLTSAGAGSCCVRGLSCRNKIRNNGGATSVVTAVMNTTMAYADCDTIPDCSPTNATMSATSPRGTMPIPT